MSTKPYPALCRDCRHSIVALGDLVCGHPKVNARNPWVLGSASAQGSECIHERRGGVFSACGMRGVLWEPREISAPQETLP